MMSFAVSDSNLHWRLLNPSPSSCVLENCNSFLCRTVCFLCFTAEPRPNVGQRPSQWRIDRDSGHRKKSRAIDVCTIYYTVENLPTCLLFLHSNWEEDGLFVLCWVFSGLVQPRGSAGTSTADGCVSGRWLIRDGMASKAKRAHLRKSSEKLWASSRKNNYFPS